MYDDLGNEIELAKPFLLLPNPYPDCSVLSAASVQADEPDWALMATYAVPDDGFHLSNDEVILPPEEPTVPSVVEPGSPEDWMTPMSSGEADLGEIVVIGPRPPTGGGGGGGGDNDWNPSHDSDNRDNDGDWGPTPPPPQTPCDLDQSKDSLAMTIEEAIKAMPDWNEREYGALILRDASGYIYMSELARGETVAEAQARATAAGETSFEPRTRFGSVPSGFTVVGVVHNHPDVGYNPSEDLQNHYPSSYSGGGDYHTFSSLVGVDPRFAFPAEFTQYILGPDGILREFDFMEGQVTAATDTRTNRDDLSSDRPCNS